MHNQKEYVKIKEVNTKELRNIILNDVTGNNIEDHYINYNNLGFVKALRKMLNPVINETEQEYACTIINQDSTLSNEIRSFYKIPEKLEHVIYDSIKQHTNPDKKIKVTYFVLLNNKKIERVINKEFLEFTQQNKARTLSLNEFLIKLSKKNIKN